MTETAERIAREVAERRDPKMPLTAENVLDALEEAAGEAQKPLVAARAYAQKVYDSCEIPTTDSRESAMFYFAKTFIELLDGEAE